MDWHDWATAGVVGGAVLTIMRLWGMVRESVRKEADMMSRIGRMEERHDKHEERSDARNERVYARLRETERLTTDNRIEIARMQGSKKA